MSNFMEQFTYDPDSTSKCWYKGICGKKGEFCDKNEFCVRHYKMSYLTHKALMDNGLQYTIDLTPGWDAGRQRNDKTAFNTLANLQKNINEFVNDGRSVLIYSENNGNGKTEWAKKLMMSWFDSIWSNTDLTCRGLFIPVSEFLSKAKENIDHPSEYYAYVKEWGAEADVVVFDGLDAKGITAYDRTILNDFLERRLTSKKSCIYTASCNLGYLRKQLEKRLSSRIIDGSECIEFVGIDRRGDWHKGVKRNG